MYGNLKNGALIGAITTLFILISLTAALALPVCASLPLASPQVRVRSVGDLVPQHPPGEVKPSNKRSLLDELPLFGTTILVDPGHGGLDPGAISGGVQEKDVVLNVSTLLKSKLEALGADVAMTRHLDETLTLQQRLDASNQLCPDVFVAIHGNSVARQHIRGIETYYYDSRDQKLADVFLDTLSSELHEQAKWSRARSLFVLDGNNVPATLVEIGYLTNNRTRALLKTAAYQDKVASALASSLVAYFADHASERGCLTT